MLFPILASAIGLGLIVYLQIGRALGGLRWDLWDQPAESSLRWFCFPVSSIFTNNNRKELFIMDEFQTREGYQMFMAFLWPTTIGWSLFVGSVVLLGGACVGTIYGAIKVLQRPVEALIFGPPKLYWRISEARNTKQRQPILPSPKAVTSADALSEIAQLKQTREDIDTRIAELTNHNEAVCEVEKIAPAS